MNEAYLRLVDCNRLAWKSLVDFARSRGNQKRGGDLHKTALDEALLVPAVRIRTWVWLYDRSRD